MFGQQFYFQTIRKYVALFGTLFNDIHIARTNSAGNTTAYIKVPITYAPKPARKMVKVKALKKLKDLI